MLQNECSPLTENSVPSKTGGNKEAQLISRDAVVGQWVHSHEDDHDGMQVFRPAPYPFPPARGRTAFTLQPDGSAVTGQPGPVDRGESLEGTWDFTGNVLTIRGPGRIADYAVLSADSDRLQLRPIQSDLDRERHPET